MILCLRPTRNVVSPLLSLFSKSRHISETNDADFEVYLDIWGSKSVLVDEALCSLTSAISRKARGDPTPVQDQLCKTLKAELYLRVGEIQRCLSSDREDVIDQGCQALEGIFYAFINPYRHDLVQGWLSTVNESKSSLNSHGALMALGIAYRHVWRQNQELGNIIREALLSQTEGRDYVAEVWALRSLASSVLVEEGTRFQVVMCNRNTHCPRSASYHH